MPNVRVRQPGINIVCSHVGASTRAGLLGNRAGGPAKLDDEQIPNVTAPPFVIENPVGEGRIRQSEKVSKFTSSRAGFPPSISWARETRGEKLLEQNTDFGERW